MPTAAFNKVNGFVEALGLEKHQLEMDVLKVMLSNAVPATPLVKADVTEIAAGNGYAAGGAVAANNTYVQAAGVAKLVADDVVFTATGGSIGPFRYAWLYNDSAADKNLIGYYDYGSSQTLGDGETLTVDFNQAAGILTIT